jgi:hypothetical protein
MDWLRYLRSLEAGRIYRLQSLRSLWLQKKIETTDISESEWSMIQQQEEWLLEE